MCAANARRRSRRRDTEVRPRANTGAQREGNPINSCTRSSKPSTFRKQAEAIWSEDERLAFIDWIAANPDAGEVIPEADGARKTRWSRAGRGKRGGARMIYLHLATEEVVLLIMVYAKAERENVKAKDIRTRSRKR